ncbi:MAG: Gfo/Idh/MocA family oxidoreductase [Planctomycetota bacterium]|nr:MAG: Gfo/Idh/MocA family oxidoreductase [Planctomycetota bacterium]
MVMLFDQEFGTLRRRLIKVVAILAVCSVNIQAKNMPTFPGAEGFGCDTPGGRGGKVLIVTNLNDTGAGSFREACMHEGPRIIVFNVGGYITLETDIDIKHPFCTISGQTAPGDGICIRGAGINILTHDIVVHYVRFRMGRIADHKIEHSRDCIDIVGKPPSYNVVLDHCSISWAVSRNIVTWNDAHDITVQWCIISEGLYDPGVLKSALEGKGFLVGDRTHRISIHHCLFAHNYQRNPRLKHGVHADLVNNVVYNWDDGAAVLVGDFLRAKDAPAVQANIINNWFQAGANTTPESPVINALTSATIHVAGNVSDHTWYKKDMLESLQWLTLSDKPFAAAPVNLLSVKEAYRRVLTGAGVTYPVRDAVDERVIKEVREGIGHHIRHQDEVGGWCKLAEGESRKDSDSDGMPDSWEIEHKLNPNDSSDASADYDGDGYTNVEEWINGLTDPKPSLRVSVNKAIKKGQKVYKVGILGNCCTHGAMLCRKFNNRPETHVVAGYEKNPRRGKELEECLGMPLAGSYDAVINHPQVDFVAVACDPCDKAEIVEKAAVAGKHIFLNKPFSESLASARRIARAVKKHKVYLVHDIPMVRFIPVYARLLREVRAGKYGKVMGYHHLFGMNFAPDFDLETRWPERLDPPEKSGGGEITNMGCYAIDFAVSLFGKPKAVTAKWRKMWDVYKEADVENFGQIVLDYGDFFAFLEVGKQQLKGERRHSNSMTINFEHTTLHIDARAEAVTVNHIHQDYEKFARDAKAVDSVDQMIAAIERGIPPTSNIETALIATETLMAAYRSVVDRRTVELPLESEENPLIVTQEK